MKFKHEPKVQMVPLDKITVVNQRTRGKDKHQQIINNIAAVGLKKPANVARRVDKDGEVHYDLGCGQGRLEAFAALGQTEMPVLVVEADREGLMLMSLAENLARRNRTTLEMAREIVRMKERGDKAAEIARKTGLTMGYVHCILRLMRDGEERLVVAVERGTVPISVAVAIADSDDAQVQRAMTDAYEKGQLKGKALFKARRLVDERGTQGAEMPEYFEMAWAKCPMLAL